MRADGVQVVSEISQKFRIKLLTFHSKTWASFWSADEGSMVKIINFHLEVCL